jgi:thiol:disulfide interchange protein
LTVDLKRDLFHVAFDPEQVTPERLLEAVRTKGFRGEVVKDRPVASEPVEKGRRDLGRLPERLRRAVEEARKERKPILFAFHGSGCPPCKKMDAVTYADEGVKEELRSWVLVQVDIAENAEVAELFGVTGIPVAVAVGTGGDELGRVADYVEPAAFRTRLERFRPR